MSKAELARKIAQELYNKLDNRGCFNGIDEEIMDEINEEMLKTIVSLLPGE